MNLSKSVLFSSLVLAFAVVGCAAQTSDADDAVASSGANEAALSTSHVTASQWNRESASLSCGATVNGTIARGDAMQYFAYAATAGQATTFDVVGQWPASYGAAILVTDARYNVLAAQTAADASVSVDLTFHTAGKSYVFVAPLRPSSVRHAYAYTLSAKCHGAWCADNSACAPGEQCQLPPRGTALGTCTAQPLCVQVTANDGRFLAKNFAAGQYAQADAWAQANAGGGAYGISLATCDVVATSTMCMQLYKPVCGVSFDGAKTYGNDCTYRAAVMTAAGQFGEAAAKAIDGVCAEAGNPSCATFYFGAETDASRAYYASNWNSAEEASAYLSLNTTAVQPRVLDGACNAPSMCSQLYMPVCGGVGDDTRTYANRCELEVAVRASAGADGTAKGHYAQGACTN